MHKFLNMTDHTGHHFTQPSFADRKAELWRKWREAQKVNEAWRASINDKGQHGTIPVKQVEQYHSIELLKAAE